jgi:hypothetical protein
MVSADGRRGIVIVNLDSRKDNQVDNTVLIRIIAGVSFMVVLIFLIQRRRTRVR